MLDYRQYPHTGAAMKKVKIPWKWIVPGTMLLVLVLRGIISQNIIEVIVFSFIISLVLLASVAIEYRRRQLSQKFASPASSPGGGGPASNKKPQ